jgi:ATP-dependent DNA ligase
VKPPVAPMLGKPASELPVDGFLYEPKWDGFRCLAFGADLRSRNDRPLARYFPELVDALRGVDAVLDGEIVADSFAALMMRLHPAASRVERLRAESPARYMAFDVLAVGDSELVARPLLERREALESLLADAEAPLCLSPATDDVGVAREWLESHEGVMAKAGDSRYEPGARTMVKVKRVRTAECVVAGCRLRADVPLIGSLLLGLYDDDGLLRHVGVSSAFTAKRRRELAEDVAPHVVPLAGHPWEEGFLLGGGPQGRLPGAAGRWSAAEMELDWIPLAPALVCEVRYDHLDGDRFRHPARFVRWRPDRDPASCRLEQLS